MVVMRPCISGYCGTTGSLELKAELVELPNFRLRVLSYLRLR